MQNNPFFDLIPLIIFFGVYYFTKNIFLATGVCIVATWLQLLWCYLKYKTISRNLWLSAVLITLFGGLTIILHNKTFVMLKPTVLFWLIGTSMIISQLFGKNGLELMLKKEITLPQSIWKKLNLAWAGFFIAVGALNLFVAFNLSEGNWVKFKVFGMPALSLIFLIITAIIIAVIKKHEEKKQHAQ